MLREHRTRAADATIAVLPVRREEASRLGIVRPDEGSRIVDLVEKPQPPQQMDRCGRRPAGWRAGA